MLSTKTFSALNDEYKSIMKPHFNSKNFLVFKYYSPRYEQLFLRGSIYQEASSLHGAHINGGSCTLYYHKDLFQLKNKIKTSGEIQLALNLELHKYIRNLRSRIKFRTDYVRESYDGKVKLLWIEDKFNIKTTLDLSSHKCISLKALGLILNEPNHQLGLGAAAAFALENKQFSIYNTTFWYARNNTKFVFTHKTLRNRFGKGDLIGLIYNKINEKTDAALGFRHSFVKQNDLITLGLRYKHSEEFSLKSKMDSNLNVKAAFQLNLNKDVELVITSNYNVAEADSVLRSSKIESLPPISLKISFGDFRK